MIDRKQLLDDLQKLLPKVEADLLERSESAEVPDVGRTLREEYAAAQAAERTAQGFEEWRSDAITQTAAAWVLSCVFVRFLEDNGLVETPKVAGPGERLKRARDEHELYFRTHPTQTDRDYLFSVFDTLANSSATRDVFGKHNPIHDLPNWLSGDAAEALITFFQKIDPNSGALVHDFTDSEWDTRFLGDLYQDLSESAREKYALLQTPVFVEKFILDRTLDPAIEEFGVAKPGYEARLLPDGRLNPDDCFRMIDPACGSGHFLLGSFERLVERWRKKEPGAKAAVLVQRALDTIHGVDVNPFAVAISRFRLLLASLRECGVTRLRDTPGFAIHVACGDSLLHGSPRGDQQTMGWAPTDHAYQPEDREALESILRPASYHAVTGNPPYVLPNDKALNEAYRARYSSCHRQYQLSVPFAQRILSLAAPGGYTGQITSNSFATAAFGKPLVNDYLSKVDVTAVIDTSRAVIPGHGTPTLILLARAQKPLSSLVRAVMGKKGEMTLPEDPTKGEVWKSIADLVDLPGSENDFISVLDRPRSAYLRHPWTVVGGGVVLELKNLLIACSQSTLSSCTLSAGFYQDTHADEAFIQPRGFDRRRRCADSFRDYAKGEKVRNWHVLSDDRILFPYTKLLTVWDEVPQESKWSWFHSLRTMLNSRIDFSGKTYAGAGRPWFSYHQFPVSRAKAKLTITFAATASHNHFLIPPQRVVLNRSAPVLAIRENTHPVEGLLGVLNSSIACLWLRQNSQPKGGGGIGRGLTPFAYEQRYQFECPAVLSFPIPRELPIESASKIMDLVTLRSQTSPASILSSWSKEDHTIGGGAETLRKALDEGRDRYCKLESEMVYRQEELDWECYHRYSILDEPVNNPHLSILLIPGQRAFEIVMARKIAAGTLRTSWFDRHGIRACADFPSEWPEEYRQLVGRRIELIESEPFLEVLEQPEYKRRWNSKPWGEQLSAELQSWLLERLESYLDFDGRMNDEAKPTARLDIALTSVGKLADVARQDAEFLQVGELYRDDPAFDVSRLVAELVEAESVPVLPILRYKPSGLRKREEWEKTWELQRQEDAIDARTKLPTDHRDHLNEHDAEMLKKKQVGTIPVPPKYKREDFLKGDYWGLRDKLDVPRERWVSFPYCEGEDGTLMVAWAGYDHLQLARAISAYYVDVQERLGGRDDPRLVPLLACLIELLPWLKQWHNEVDPEFGVAMGDYFEGFLQEESRNLGITLDEIRAWQPPQRAGGRGRRRANG